MISIRMLYVAGLVAGLSLSALAVARVVEVGSKRDFDTVTKQGAVVVKFFATWCGPCKQLKPVYEEIVGDQSFSDIVFVEVDIDKLSDVANKFNVKGVPTTIFFVDGKEVDRIVGGQGFKSKTANIISTKLKSEVKKKGQQVVAEKPAEKKAIPVTVAPRAQDKKADKKVQPQATAPIKKAAPEKIAAPKKASATCP